LSIERLRRAVAVAALVFAGGCQTTTPLESATSTIVVHSVLNASQDDQLVEVLRTTNGFAYGSFVDSALVTITGPDGVAMTGVTQPGTTTYHVSLSSYHKALVAGGTYHLRVRLKTGEEVTGTTIIPNAQPSSATPSPVPFNDATDTLRLSWSAVQGATSYEVRVESGTHVYALFADTSVALPGTLRTLEGTIVFTRGAVNTVIVSAVDAAYYEYYRTNSDGFTGAAVQGNLSGAEGVFGSIVVLSVGALRVP
jgi:hypothetical protein